MARICLAIILSLLCVVGHAQRDPTMPRGGFYVGGDTVVEEEAATLAAKLVLVGDERKLALVNGRTLSVGDEFEGGKILEISENGVEVLQADGEIVFLPVQSVQKSPSWKFLKVYRDE